MTRDDKWPTGGACPPGPGDAAGPGSDPRPTGDPGQAECALEAFFQAAREEHAAADGDFLARLVRDALDEQDRQRAAAVAGRASASPADTTGGALRRWLRGAAAAIGGLPGTGVLAASAMLGLWVGYADPSGLVTQTLQGALQGALQGTFPAVLSDSAQTRQDSGEMTDILTDLYLYTGEG